MLVATVSVARLPRLEFESGTLEALKWFAVVCMVLDHANRVFTGYTLGPVAEFFGRLAFPIFAVVFGYNLARPGLDHLKVMQRVLWVALLASPVYALVLSPMPLNVLWTLGAAAGAVLLWERGSPVLAGCLFLGAGAYVDYLWPGLALVLCAFWYARRPRLLPIALAVASVAWYGTWLGNQYALAAFPLLILASRLTLPVPRMGRFFLWFYPAHLLALAILVTVARGWGA